MIDLFFTLESPNGEIIKKEKFLSDVITVESAGADDYWITTVDGKRAVYRDGYKEGSNKWYIVASDGNAIYTLIKGSNNVKKSEGNWFAHVTLNNEIIVSRSQYCEHPDGIEATIVAFSKDEAYDKANEYLYS